MFCYLLSKEDYQMPKFSNKNNLLKYLMFHCLSVQTFNCSLFVPMFNLIKCALLKVFCMTSIRP